jgi:hypothetical protein
MKNTPAYIAYHVRETAAGEHGEKRGVWTRVGAAWPNKDGKGFNVLLDVMPLDGRLILREQGSGQNDVKMSAKTEAIVVQRPTGWP